MNKLLLDYIGDSRNQETNFELGFDYESKGQTASAISFYLRTANVTNDNTLAYECLLRIGLCFEKQQNRDETVQNVYKHAITICPERPEGYFLLSVFFETRRNYVDAYTFASIGLERANFDLKPLIKPTPYTGKYLLLFEKAVSAWHWEKGEESRKLFQELLENHSHELDEIHRNSIWSNIDFLGAGPEDLSHFKYNIALHDKLKFKFPGSDTIHRNYSQAFQDMFVLYMHQGKTNGTFLEIGSADPYYGNNTALLEQRYGWTGTAIEYDNNLSQSYKNHRPNVNSLCVDATTIDYRELLSKNFAGNVIDYLQLDIDPPDRTYSLLDLIPFDQYKFAVITYEHDYYMDKTRSFRGKSRKFLTEMGYELVLTNVAGNESSAFEDWWVHPDLIPREIIDSIKSVGPDVKKITNYVLEDDLSGTEIYSLPQNKPSFSMINTNKRKGLFVVDNFYNDPYAVREYALQQEYHQGGLGRGYIGRRTFQQFLFPGIKESFEQIIGQKITQWESHGMNGRFQYSMEGEPLVYHCDSQRWAAMIYLTPNAPHETGTSTYALKGTDIMHSSHPDIMKCFREGSQNLDKTPFETVDSIGNVFNRLVIFDAHYLHAASGYFGFKPENARLWHMFFFD